LIVRRKRVGTLKETSFKAKQRKEVRAKKQRRMTTVGASIGLKVKGNEWDGTGREAT
jgi:hypothetical protein